MGVSGSSEVSGGRANERSVCELPERWVPARRGAARLGGGRGEAAEAAAQDIPALGRAPAASPCGGAAAGRPARSAGEESAGLEVALPLPGHRCSCCSGREESSCCCCSSSPGGGVRSAPRAAPPAGGCTGRLASVSRGGPAPRSRRIQRGAAGAGRPGAAGEEEVAAPRHLGSQVRADPARCRAEAAAERARARRAGYPPGRKFLVKSLWGGRRGQGKSRKGPRFALWQRWPL